MISQLTLTAAALGPNPIGLAAAREEIKLRHRLAILVAVGVLGFAALAPTGASACGRPPAGAEAAGPIPRGAAGSHEAPAQPVIYPHCSFNPMPDRVAVDGSAGNPNNPDAKSVGPIGRVD